MGSGPIVYQVKANEQFLDEFSTREEAQDFLESIDVEDGELDLVETRHWIPDHLLDHFQGDAEQVAMEEAQIEADQEEIERKRVQQQRRIERDQAGVLPPAPLVQPEALVEEPEKENT